jgi:hypothetical protein
MTWTFLSLPFPPSLSPSLSLSPLSLSLSHSHLTNGRKYSNTVLNFTISESLVPMPARNITVLLFIYRTRLYVFQNIR